MNRWSIWAQFVWASIFGVVLVGVGVYLLAGEVHKNNLKNEARSITSLVENVGTWAADYKGIWVKSIDNNDVGKSLEAFRYTSSASSDVEEDAIAVSYHRKNPVLVQRELSDVTQKSESKAKFRILSDNPMNPNNKVGLFEKDALDAMRNDGKSEYFVLSDGEFRYAKMIKASKSCLACHTSAETAPESVKRSYGSSSGYGYKEGDIVGVISVSLQNKASVDGVMSYLSWRALAGVGLMLMALVMMMSFVRSQLRGIVSLKNLTGRLIKGGVDSDVSKENAEELSKSSNELDTLKGSIFALYQSIQYLQRRKGE